MKKKSRNLIIMALALAVLAGAYFTWRAVGGNGDGTDTSGGDTSYSVGAVDYKTLSFVSVSRRTEPESEGGEPGRIEFEFRLNEGGSAWLWSEDENVPLDNEQFADMATAVSSLTSPYRLEGISAAELSKYGLDDPEITLTFTDDNGTHRFYIGAKSSFNGANYFCNDDKTIQLRNLYFYITSAYPAVPVENDTIDPGVVSSIRVGLFKDQKLVAWAEPCDQPPNYKGFEDAAFYSLPFTRVAVENGSKLEAAAVVTDQYGRELVLCQDVFERSDDELIYADTADISTDPKDWTY